MGLCEGLDKKFHEVVVLGLISCKEERVVKRVDLFQAKYEGLL